MYDINTNLTPLKNDDDETPALFLPEKNPNAASRKKREWGGGKKRKARHRALFVRWWGNEIINACKFIKENGQAQFSRGSRERTCDFSVPGGYRGLYPLARSVSNKMNDTEHEVPRERERYLAFSDTRGSIHPSTRTGSAVITTRENVGVQRARGTAFVFPLKIISIFVGRGERSGRDCARRVISLFLFPPAKFIITGVNERTFSHSRCTFVPRLTRVTAICLCKFDTAVINSQGK